MSVNFRHQGMKRGISTDMPLWESAFAGLRGDALLGSTFRLGHPGDTQTFLGLHPLGHRRFAPMFKSVPDRFVAFGCTKAVLSFRASPRQMAGFSDLAQRQFNKAYF
ncbi:hypothetical protein [Gallaecimonas sp. GXIMD4217]|uniref:hypothetical protein n=1 Tax=Gallaecimonas sp. GXIMD4217 TaxID=3131927 RepID=UPI00311B046E